jgi:hypothetical protein
MSETSDDVAVAIRASTEPKQSGPVAELALVAAGLGLVVYLLGFVTDFGIGSLVFGPLLVGGGLLAGTAVLPGVGNRMVVPAAVAVVTGALLLLQVVVGGTASAVAVAALVLALLEAAAAVGAVLLHLGVVPARMPTGLPANVRGRLPKLRRKRGAAAEQPPLYPGYPQRSGAPGYPQYPGQQPTAYPGLFEGPPGDRYAGEHAYAQNARYGAQYGVPGYPPPPYGYDPGGYGGAPGQGRTDAPAPDPTADPVTVVVPPGRSGGEPSAPAVSPPSPSSASSGSSRAEAADRPADGAGAHRAVDPDPSSTPAAGSHRADPFPPSGTGAADEEQDRTRVLPTVPPERPPA